ncbi:hypothetical protein [Rhizobium leguminosarum]|uniref:hypothetical protein n=1 Tax=Rhizobium leguminosarum TaxID=384 RepID=UPI003D7C154F
MNDYIRKAERHLAAATADIGVAESQALRAQVKITQETLALSIGSYKDGQSSLLDAGCAAFGRDQSGQPGAGGAANGEGLCSECGNWFGYNFSGAAIRPNSYEH